MGQQMHPSVTRSSNIYSGLQATPDIEKRRKASCQRAARSKTTYNTEQHAIAHASPERQTAKKRHTFTSLRRSGISGLFTRHLTDFARSGNSLQSSLPPNSSARAQVHFNEHHQSSTDMTSTLDPRHPTCRTLHITSMDDVWRSPESSLMDGSEDRAPPYKQATPRLQRTRTFRGLKSRLKESISNMSLRSGFKQHKDNDATDTQSGKSPRTVTSQLSLREAFRRHQNQDEPETGHVGLLKNAISNMSLWRTFQRQQPDDYTLQEGTHPTSGRKRHVLQGQSSARSLRQKISNLSLRAGFTRPSIDDDIDSVVEDPFVPPRRKRLALLGQPPSRGLGQSVGDLALRTGLASPEPEHGIPEQSRWPLSVRRNRLAIPGHLPSRGHVLIPPIQESPRNSDYQLIVNPEVMIRDSRGPAGEQCGDLRVAKKLQPQDPSSTMRRHDEFMDTHDSSFTLRKQAPRDKHCDPETLALLTSASYSSAAVTRTPKYLGDFSSVATSDPRHHRMPSPAESSGDDGYRPSSRDDVSELHEDELAALVNIGSRSVSPIAAAVDLPDHARPESGVFGNSGQQQVLIENIRRLVERRPSLSPHRTTQVQQDLDWTLGDASDFAVYLQAAECGML